MDLIEPSAVFFISETLNGPAPTALRFASESRKLRPERADQRCFGIIPSVKLLIKELETSFKVNDTVKSSIFWTLTRIQLVRSADSVSADWMVWTVNTTSSAVRGLPSCQRKLVLSLIV